MIEDKELPAHEQGKREEAYNDAECKEIKNLWTELKTLDNARDFAANLDEREYLQRFTVPRYKIAYIDCVTKRACTEWFSANELEKGVKS